MAQLFALNREETLEPIRQLLERGFLPFFNRGPLSCFFSVARRTLADGIDWTDLFPEEKTDRVWEMLSYDLGFIRVLAELSPVNLYLDLESSQAMQLAKERALSTLGGEPDRHESDYDLQRLTGEIYRSACAVQVEGVEMRRVLAERGSAERLFKEEDREGLHEWMERSGIQMTANFVGRELSWILDLSKGELIPSFQQQIDHYIGWLRSLRKEGGEPEFEFRRKLELPIDLGLGYSEGRLEQIGEMVSDDRAIKVLSESANFDLRRVVRERG